MSISDGNIVRKLGRFGAALLLSGALALGAACGGGGGTEEGAPGVVGEVNISETEAAAEPAEPVEPIAETAPPPTPSLTGDERDPFSNPAAGTAVAADTAGVEEEVPVEEPPPDQGGPGVDGGMGEETPAKPAEPTFVAPDFKVSGILRSPAGDKAILNGEDQSYIISEGDKIGDYVVVSIDADKVTMRYQEHTFKVELMDEFSADKPKP